MSQGSIRTLFTLVTCNVKKNLTMKHNVALTPPKYCPDIRETSVAIPAKLEELSNNSLDFRDRTHFEVISEEILRFKR